MSNYWRLHCKTCEAYSETSMNHGDDVLRSVAKAAQQCKALLEADKTGYIEISVMAHGGELISFAVQHAKHDLELADEYGRFEPVLLPEQEETPQQPAGGWAKQREIKLRAWDKERKAMFQVCELTFDAQYESGLSFVGAYPYDQWNPSQDEQGNWADRAPRPALEWSYRHRAIEEKLVLMWSTGYEDSQKNEIYEGDILEAPEFWGERDYATVIWHEQKLQWWLTRLNQQTDNRVPYQPLRTPFANGHMAFVIVGNIYENPELIHGPAS